MGNICIGNIIYIISLGLALLGWGWGWSWGWGLYRFSFRYRLSLYILIDADIEINLSLTGVSILELKGQAPLAAKTLIFSEHLNREIQLDFCSFLAVPSLRGG